MIITRIFHIYNLFCDCNAGLVRFRHSTGCVSCTFEIIYVVVAITHLKLRGDINYEVTKFPPKFRLELAISIEYSDCKWGLELRWNTRKLLCTTGHVRLNLDCTRVAECEL